MEPRGLWTYVWPGLPRLWIAGQPLGLLVALGFTVVLNAALWLSWSGELSLGTGGDAALWTGVALFWCVSAWDSHRWRQSVARLPKREELDSLLAEAQTKYLCGHWLETETILNRLLAVAEGDLEARLLLATLYRRTQRAEEARAQLEDMVRRDGVERWANEIQRELEYLDERRERAAA